MLLTSLAVMSFTAAAVAPAMAQDTKVFKIKYTTDGIAPKNYSVDPTARKPDQKEAWICQAGYLTCYYAYSYGVGSPCMCNGWAGFIVG